MKEYIERSDIFPNGVFFVNENNPLASLDELIKRIWSIPAANVVEVVRCKECRRRYDADECPMCVLIDGEYLEYTYGNGFCDRGEKKEDTP